MALISAQDVYTLYRPSLCRRRVYLAANRPKLAAPPSDYDLLVAELGRRHEQSHLATLPEAVTPTYAPGDMTAGALETVQLIQVRAPVIYQAVLLAAAQGLLGIPDFLILEEGGYVIRDAKLAVNLDVHPEIQIQLSLYARAFEESLCAQPLATEVVRGDGEVVRTEAADVSQIVDEVARLKEATHDVDEAVGWSKCSECHFREYCWHQAEESHDPGVVYGIDQGLRNRLVCMGLSTYDQIAQLSQKELAGIRRQWGHREQRVGDARAERIQRQVRVLMSGSDEQFGAPQLPASGACVFLDVESDPHDEVLGNKVYLWGVLADRGDGSEPEYWGNLAGPGDEGDKTGWFDFLRHAENLLAHLGDAPFVHYSHYEKTWLRKYAERWGDPDGTAARLGGMLWDMQLQGIRDVFCLPVPSYGLKSVENYVGFERSTQEYGGLWAVVRYHEWLQADREDERERVRDELLRYNREDCEAMRHVLEWIRQAKEGRQSR